MIQNRLGVKKLIPKMLEMYKKMNIRFSTAIIIYAIVEVILYVLGLISMNTNGILGVISGIITLFACMLILEIKVSYPQCFDTVNLGLYFLFLILFPWIATPLVEKYILTNVYMNKIDVSALLKLIAHLILYIRAYILAKKYDMDFM